MASFIFFSFANASDFKYEIDKWEFYSSVYDDIDSANDRAAKKVSLETWISEEALVSLFYNLDDNFPEIKKYCDKESNKNYSSCHNSLNKKLLFEKENEEFLFELEEYWKYNQIWADWDLDNSFFDIVYDLNVIDYILFWEDSTELSMDLINLDFWKWDDDDKNPDSQDPWSSDNETSSSSSSSSSSWDWNSNPDTSSSWWWPWDNSSSSSSSSTWSSWDPKTNDSNEICIDPLLYKKTQKENDKEKDNNDDYNSRENKKKKEFNNALSSNENFSNLDPDLAYEIFHWNTELLKNSSNSKYWFSGLDKKIPNENCKKPIYWWLICLDDLFYCNDNEMFCVEVNFKETVLESYYAKESSCVNCFVEFMLKTIKEELLWKTLNPKENSIKSPSVTNWLTIFWWFSPNLDISYKPLPWDKEINNFEETEEEKIFESIINPSVTNCEDANTKAETSIEKQNNEIAICKETQEYIKEKETEREVYQNITKSKKFFEADASGRFEEFKDLFEAWVLNNIRWFPIEKLEDLTKRKCKNYTPKN